jgi:hypothetical protein
MAGSLFGGVGYLPFHWRDRVGIIWSNTLLKILVGMAVITVVVGVYMSPPTSQPCVSISKFPNRSQVFQCPKGLSSVILRNDNPIGVYTTVSTDVQTQAWLVEVGTKADEKHLDKLGSAAILGPGAFLAVGNGKGLVYIEGKTSYLVTIVWDNAPAK